MNDHDGVDIRVVGWFWINVAINNDRLHNCEAGRCDKFQLDANKLNLRICMFQECIPYIHSSTFWWYEITGNKCKMMKWIWSMY